MNTWPFTTKHVMHHHEVPERLAEQLRMAMGHIDELHRHRDVVKGRLADLHVERQYEIRTARAAIDAVQQEKLLREVAEIDEREREVRAELAAAHARATDRRPVSSLPDAHRGLTNARAAEEIAREHVVAAYDRPIKLQRARRRIAIIAVAIPLVWALVWLAVGIVTGEWRWWAPVLPALAVVVGIAVIRFLDGELATARADVGPAIDRHENRLHELMLAEAEFRIAGGDITRI